MAPTPWTSETHSDPPPRRKLRWVGLWLPWGAVVVLAALWSLGWLWLMHETERRLDAGAASLRKAGWTVAWDARHVGGYPFRLDVDFAGLRIADPSGWAAATRTLKTEAYAFAPTHRVFFAPDGLAFVRPDGGAVGVSASAVRGSVDGSEALPRLALEGDDLTFTPAPGAKLFSFAAAKNLQFYTRAGPNDQEAVFFSLDGGRASPRGWVAQLAGAAPVAIKLDGVLSHTDYLKGDTWRHLVADWSTNGGTFDVHQLTLSGGEALLVANGGGVAVGADGKLVGVLETSVRDPLRVLSVTQGGKPGPAPASAPKDAAIPARLTFRDGQTWLGPLKLMKAPWLY